MTSRTAFLTVSSVDVYRVERDVLLKASSNEITERGPKYNRLRGDGQVERTETLPRPLPWPPVAGAAMGGAQGGEFSKEVLMESFREPPSLPREGPRVGLRRRMGPREGLRSSEGLPFDTPACLLLSFFQPNIATRDRLATRVLNSYERNSIRHQRRPRETPGGAL